MKKQNLLFKKISRQILSINNLLENYFNSLRRFILDAKRFRFDKNNKVFLTIVSIIFLTLTYFLIPTAYNKELIRKEIKNQINQKYSINIKFNNSIQYNFFPGHILVQKICPYWIIKKKLEKLKISKYLLILRIFLNLIKFKHKM